MTFPEIEFDTPENIEKLQEQLLRQSLAYVNANSPFYRKRFAEHGIDITAITSVADLVKIPVTTKDELQLHNDEFLCVPRHEIIDYSTTSGTLGDPVTFGLTDKDLDRLAYNEAISFDCTGIKKGDVVQLMTTIDRRFVAGLAYFLGLRKLGAGIIRVGAGIPQLQWDSILKYKPKYLITVPSFLLKLIEYAENHGIDYQNSGIVGAICIGEPLRDQDFSNNMLAAKITDKWKIKLLSTYASTEMSTAFTECGFQNGGHHHPELIIVEILDDKNHPVAHGQSGELTITTLGVEGMPLVRFKTGDIVTLHTERCRCGRTTSRVGSVLGRKQHMIKYKGTTLYPPAMHDVLTHFDQVDNHCIEITSNEFGSDEILVRIAAKIWDESLLLEIKDYFRAKLRVAPKIEFADSDALNADVFPPMGRKPVRFIDKR